MIFQSTNFLVIKKELENSLNSFPLFLEPIFVNYLKKYNSESNFFDISFILKKNKTSLYCPLTIENKNNKKILNFFGEPFSIICQSITEEMIDLFSIKIQEIVLKKKIDEINFLFQKNIDNFETLNVNNLNLFNKISNRKYIDLTLDLDQINKKFSKGHKSAIKKNYDDLDYKVIDDTNYKNDILDMMKMHQIVSQKITRSKETWLLNGEMIKNKNGILTNVFYKNKIISFSFFFLIKMRLCILALVLIEITLKIL